MVTARDVRDLLDERPDLEPTIEAVLDAEPPWTFHDVDVDSGRFGELVARGVVEETNNGYRVADPEVVARGLAGETDITEAEAPGLTLPDFSITRLEAGAVLGALGLVVAFRIVALPNVYVDDQVVLSGNDPYFYRYLVEQLLVSPDVTPSNLGFGVAHGEPLLVVTLWLVTLALGGSLETAGHVMAWYPVLTAVLTALFVYGVTVLVTDDRRIGLAAVAMLAVLPGHALRTSLGFADHHAFDYLWLAVTLFGVVLVSRASYREDSPVELPTLAGVATIAIAVAAQTLAWDNSPLIVAALAPYLALEALQAVHARESPARTLTPVLVGIGLATALAWIAHDWVGWHTELVISAPLLVFIGGVGVTLAADLSHRFGLPAAALAVAEAGVAGIVMLGLQTFRPETWARLLTSVESRLLAPRPIAEVQSIFSDSGGWLLLFGFILLVALPYLGWASYRAIEDARWLPPVVLGWYFFVLSTIQARFVGELSSVIVVFAGLAFVHLAERIDIAHRPAPFTSADPPDLRLPATRKAGYLVLLFLLVGGLSMVQVPVKTSQVMTPPGLSDTAFYLADHSDERGLEYPENYVFSEWSKNRVYNYFVSGESRSYGYAQSNFDAFLTSTDSTGWYDRLSDRAGFVVVTSRAVEAGPDQIGKLLYTHRGSRTDNPPGLARYRLVYVSETGEYLAFELVEGAVLTGQGPLNATVTASTVVDVPGATFTYVREANTDSAGKYTLRVAHPGTYEVDGQSVTVSEGAVWNGTSIEVGESSP